MTLTLGGNPLDDDLEFARPSAVDLIAMTTRGRSGLSQRLIGSGRPEGAERLRAADSDGEDHRRAMRDVEGRVRSPSPISTPSLRPRSTAARLPHAEPVNQKKTGRTPAIADVRPERVLESVRE